MNHSTLGAETADVSRGDREDSGPTGGEGAYDGASRHVLTSPVDGAMRRATFASANLRTALISADLVAVAIGLVATLLIVGRPAGWSDIDALLGMGGLTGIWAVAFASQRLYSSRYVERASEEARRVIAAGVLTLGGVLVGSYLLDEPAPSRTWTLVAFTAVTSVVLVERFVARLMFRRMRAQRRIVRRVALIGSDAAALALYDSIEANPSLGYEVVGLIGDTDCVGIDRPILGDLDHAAVALKAHDCVGVIVSTPSLPMFEVNKLARVLTDERFHVAFSTSLNDIDLERLRPQSLDGHTMLYVEPVVRSGWRATAKRCFDVLTATALLIVFSPIMLAAALAVRFTSEGPVLFRQVRLGRDGLPFKMLKFRTMVADAEQIKQELIEQNEADGPLFKIEDDPRVTTAGRFLRKWSIDELPQLWNVVRGEMSMVGPRPALPEEVQDWDPELRRRLSVPAGLTGLWQVSGRSDASFSVYRRLDLYYVDNWTLSHDVGVCLRTAWAVLRARGAR